MTKIAYIGKPFARRTYAVIEQANEIIEEYQADGLTLTLRQLYYQFVSRDLIPNKQSEYKRLGSIISNGRLAGLISWDAIEDRTRNLKSQSHWYNPGQIIRAATRGFYMNKWEGQSTRVEVWIEKEALTGVIASVCRKLDVPYFACKGYVSQSEMWKAGQRLINHDADETVIIHLGDHDPSGMDMTRDIADRLNLFFDYEGLEAPTIKRIALNMDQINQYNPPPNPAKLTDTRCHGYIQDYGQASWELDALEPRVLQELISSTVLEYRDDDLYNEVLKQENEYLEILKRVEENWRSL
ncbi:hypothetical protein KAR91_51435 [Candidatus Pacearchaeota archaeon]|nr:hypothetical protein [Candidatus Pacearchaeota archaeon]